MGYHGKLEEKQIAQKLRRKGLTYSEIREHVSVSKDTLSRWCRDIPLTKKHQKRILNKAALGQKKGSIIAAENKRKRRQATIKAINVSAEKDVGELSKRERFIAGIALYAGEGYKGESGNAGFANADPDLIKFMRAWFDEFCTVPDDRLRGALWLHEGLNEEKAVRFWSKVAKIPKEQFHKTYIVKNKTNSKKVRKNIHNYGVFTIRFSDTNTKRRIIGWTKALSGDKIT